MATTTPRARPAARKAPVQVSAAAHFIVCGQDELGFRAAEELRRLGEPVAFVTAAPEGKFVPRLVGMGVRIVSGNYREESVLEEAGLQAARALIVAEADDIGNLHAALAAHELNPGLRVVVRIFSPELGKRVEQLLKDCEVLSSSAIAGPAFVSAALQNDFEQEFDAFGRQLVVRHADVGGPGVLLPVARQEPDGPLVLFPDEGRGVLCIADAVQVAAAEQSQIVHRLRRRRLPGPVANALHLVGSLADRRVRYLLGVVAALVVVSMLVFHFTAGFGYLDAVYFTVTTITTIGYGDLNLLSQPDYVKVLGILLELTGAATMAIFFAVITDTLVGARLRQALGGLHREMTDHIVVCGVGNIGHRVAEQVHAMRIPVLAIELNESTKSLPELRRAGIPIVIGDAREVANLATLGVEAARCLVLTMDDDVANLEVALTARGLNPDLKIVLQLHDPDLAARVQRAIGVGVSRSSAGLAAPAFVSAALGHRILGSFPVGERMLVVAHAEVGAGAEAAGHDLTWLQSDLFGRVLMVGRAGEQTWSPPPAMSLRESDELLIVATRKALDGFLKRLGSAAGAA